MTDDVIVKAECIESDELVIGVRVTGYTASHTGEKEWSITLPYGSVFPNTATGSGITFSTKSSAKQTFKNASGDEKTKTYVFTVGETDYTVKVSIAEQRNFSLKVNIDNDGTSDAKETVPERVNLNLQLTPGFGYALPDYITVSVRKVILKPSEYTYNKSTGKLTIPGAKITGDVEITVRTVYGTVPVEVRAGHEDIYTVGYDFVKQENTQTYDPLYIMNLPRIGDGDTDIVMTTVNGNEKMVPTDSQTSSGGGNDGSQSGNSYSWVIPKWLEFILITYSQYGCVHKLVTR